MTSFRVSATLPAGPVQLPGIRAEKSPALNAARNFSRTSVSSSSTTAVLVANPPSSEAVPLGGETRLRTSPLVDGWCECFHQHKRAATPDRFWHKTGGRQAPDVSVQP